MMKERPRPETIIDLQGYFCDVLGMKPAEVEQFFEFVEWKDALGARFKRFLPEGFRELAALVKGWGGEYDKDRRQFVVPRKPREVPAATREETVEGVIERVEPKVVKDWTHVFVAGISKPLAIREDMTTPGLKPGNRIRAEVDIGEQWLFIRRFDIPKEEEEALPSQPTEAKGYAAVPEGAVIKVPVDVLVFGKFWVRKYLDPHELSRLRESIRRRGDVTYPLAVRPLGPDRLEPLGGHRRARTAKEAGVKHVSVRVFHPKTEREAWEIACQDEMHEPWSPIAKAVAYERMKQDGISVGDISLITGDSTRIIEHLLNLLKLPEDVQDIVDTGKLGPSHAEELLRLKDRPEDFMTIAIEASERLWTIQKLREEIGKILGVPPKELPPSVPEKLPEIEKEAEIGEIPEESVGEPSEVRVIPGVPYITGPPEPRRAEVPSVGFEPTPPKDALLDRALHWYQTDLLDFVWERVTIPERRQKFLKVFSAVEHELIVERGLLEEAWERAKTRFEKPEEITV